MTADVLTHLEALARGETLPREAFDAILADPDAVRELDRLLRVRSLLEDDEPLTPIATDVTLEETALYARGQLHDPARRAAVEAFLAREFSPQKLADETRTARPPP